MANIKKKNYSTNSDEFESGIKKQKLITNNKT